MERMLQIARITQLPVEHTCNGVLYQITPQTSREDLPIIWDEVVQACNKKKRCLKMPNTKQAEKQREE